MTGGSHEAVPDKDAYVALASPGTVSGLISAEVWGGGSKGRLGGIRPGAVVAVYVSGARAFAGTFDVISQYYHDAVPIWSDVLFPHRIRISARVASLDTTMWAAIADLIPRLTFIRKPDHYGAYFRSSWFRIPYPDFVEIEESLLRRRKERAGSKAENSR